jgi:hypothetical protein
MYKDTTFSKEHRQVSETTSALRPDTRMRRLEFHRNERYAKTRTGQGGTLLSLRYQAGMSPMMIKRRRGRAGFFFAVAILRGGYPCSFRNIREVYYTISSHPAKSK